MRRLILLLIVLILGMQLIQPARVHSQTATPASDVTAPVVIEALPARGEELLPNDPITLTFDQPMDAASVERALSIALPNAALMVQWVDTSTVNILNKNGWPVRSTLKLNIDKSARAASGLTLEDSFATDFTTIGPLRIGTVTPTPDTKDVSLSGTKITIAFNRPMIALTDSQSTEDAPSPLRFAPVIGGRGRWVNTSLYTWEAETLLPNTTYTVTLPKTVTSADGATLDADFVWKFTTVPIQVISVQPPASVGNAPLFQRVSITLSGAVDRPAFEQAFSLYKGGSENSPKIAGSFAWGKDARTVQFLPYQFLELNSTYQINVEGSVLGGRAFRSTFTTVPPPAVATVEAQHWSDTFVVRFNTRMNIDSMLTKFEIVPDVGPFYPLVLDEGRTIYLVKAKLEEGKTYTLRLYPGAEDIYGNKITTLYERTVTIPRRIQPTPTPRVNVGQARPILNSDVMLTGAYRAKTSVALRVTGKPKVDFKLYRVDAGSLSKTVLSNGQFSWYARSYFNARSVSVRALPTPAWVNRANLIRAWSETYDAGASGEATILAELSADGSGQKLAPGLYWVEITAPVYGHNYDSGLSLETFRYALAVSTANLTVKRGVKEIFVWATDLQTAQPIPNATISIYNKGNLIANGKTDAKGVFIGNIEGAAFVRGNDEYYDSYYEDGNTERALNTQITITAQADNVYSAWFSRNARSASGKEIYLHSDRPVYRPGEMVYFRGYLRDRFDVSYTVPTKKTVRVRGDLRYSDNSQPPLFQMDIPLTPYGSFAGEFKLPDTIAGDEEVSLRVIDSDKEFTSDDLWRYERLIILVREFRLPEFEVKWATNRPEILQGEPVDVRIVASYFAGGGVNNAKVQWRMTGVDSWFSYKGDEWYEFNADYSARECGDYYEWYGKELDDGNQNTDALGSLAINSDKTRRQTDTGTLEGEKSQSCNPLSIKLEGTVTDESGQAITARTSILAHPTTAYVGIRTNQYYIQIGKASPIRLITVTPQSQPIPNQKIDLEISRREWQRTETEGWKLIIIGEPTTAQVTTGTDGRATFEFTADQPGDYLIRAATTDSGGRVNRTATEVTALDRAVGSGYRMPSWEQNTEAESEYDGAYYNDPRFSSTQTLKTDKKTYIPGETAKVLIPAPYKVSVPMLITLERAGVFYHEIIQSGTQPTLYEFKIADAAAPGATITALALSPINADYPVPQWRYATGDFIVEPTARKLTVTVKPGTDRAKPGERVPITITVKDRDGKGVRAEVGVGVTDKAALSLVYPNSGPQLPKFYEGYDVRYNRVFTEVSMYALQERLSKVFNSEGGGAGGASGPESESPATLQIRKDYKVTPLWSPHTETDENGQAIVYVTMPDNLTTWKIDARAVTKDTSVGESTAEFISTLPLIVRPATPRFLTLGDTVELAMIVNNNSGKDQQIQARLDAKGITLLDGATQTVTVLDSGRARVAWRARVDQLVGVDLTFAAIGDGVQDAAKPALATGPNNTIPVYRLLTPDAVATAGTIRATGARTEVIALPPRFSSAEGELIVQADPSLAAAFPDSFSFLRNYPYQCNEQTVSRFLPNLYTLRALKALNLDKPELREGLDTTVKEGVKMLMDRRKPNGGWGYWPEDPDTDPLVTAYALLGLHEAQQAGYLTDPKYLDPTITYLLTEVQSKPTVSTNNWELNRRVFLLYVLNEVSDRVPQARFDELVELRFKLSLASRAYLLMSYHRRYANASGVKTLLSDLLSAASLSATGTHWTENEIDWYNWGSDTRTTALVMGALVRVQPDLDILPEAVRWLMNARSGRTWRSTQENVWSLIALTDWMIATKELSGNYQLGISLNRKSLVTRTVTPETVRESSNLKVAVTDLLTDRANRLTFSRGEGEGALYYTARLALQLPADQVKPINRGFSIQRTYFDEKGNTINSARLGDQVTVRLVFLVRDSVYYGVIEDPLPAGLESINPRLLTSGSQDRVSGNFYFRRIEYKDEQTNIHARYLPAGTYTFTYKARATTAGVFQVSPSHAFAFYAPDIFGRSAGGTFTVTP